MFNQIVLIDNVIRIAKYSLSYEIEDKEGEKTVFEEIFLTEKERDETIEQLKNLGIKFSTSEVKVPADIAEYDGMNWTKGRDEAVKMINGDVSYKIAELKDKLDKDYRYKKRIDGEYIDEEWKIIAEERRELRNKLRELIEISFAQKIIEG